MNLDRVPLIVDFFGLPLCLTILSLSLLPNKGLHFSKPIQKPKLLTTLPIPVVQQLYHSNPIKQTRSTIIIKNPPCPEFIEGPVLPYITAGTVGAVKTQKRLATPKKSAKQYSASPEGESSKRDRDFVSEPARPPGLPPWPPPGRPKTTQPQPTPQHHKKRPGQRPASLYNPRHCRGPMHKVH